VICQVIIDSLGAKVPSILDVTDKEWQCFHQPIELIIVDGTVSHVSISTIGESFNDLRWCKFTVIYTQMFGY